MNLDGPLKSQRSLKANKQKTAPKRAVFLCFNFVKELRQMGFVRLQHFI